MLSHFGLICKYMVQLSFELLLYKPVSISSLNIDQPLTLISFS